MGGSPWGGLPSTCAQICAPRPPGLSRRSPRCARASESSYFLLPTSHFPLPTSYFLLPTSHFLLPASYFLLPTSHFLLPTSHFLLPTSYFLLPASYFLLPTSYFLQVGESLRELANDTPASAVAAEGGVGLPPRNCRLVSMYEQTRQVGLNDPMYTPYFNDPKYFRLPTSYRLGSTTQSTRAT